jgi:hypothetical protein
VEDGAGFVLLVGGRGVVIGLCLYAGVLLELKLLDLDPSLFGYHLLGELGVGFVVVLALSIH